MSIEVPSLPVEVRAIDQVSPEQAHVVAVDLGTGGPKAAVVSGSGELVAHAFEPVGLHLIEGGGAEQDPGAWWAAVVTTVRRAVEASGIAADQVVGLGCTAQWAATVAVGPDGEAIGPAISWLDTRGSAITRGLVGGPASVMGYDVVKAQRWIRLTGGAPSLSGRDPVGHIGFLRRHRPDVYQAAVTFLEPVDWLNLKLTGLARASWDSIGLYWATDNRDIATVRYDERLVAWAGLERRKLPELVPTNTVLGGLSPAAAEELGLVPGTPVATGTGDLHSAAVGSGAVADFDAHLYIGTSSWISCHVPFKKTDPLRNVGSIPAGLPGRYLVADEHETAGAALEWLRDRLLFPDDALSSPAPDDFFGLVNEVAASIPVGSHGVIFTPWLNGERTPVDDHTIRAGFHNLSLSTSRVDLVRAVFEGVALNSQWLLGAVERLVGRRLDHLAFVGGGANSALWAQIHADATDRVVQPVRDPVLANVRGAGLLTLLALGAITVEQIPAMVPLGPQYRPEPSAVATYRELGQELVNLYRRTKGIHRRLNRRR